MPVVEGPVEAVEVPNLHLMGRGKVEREVELEGLPVPVDWGLGGLAVPEAHWLREAGLVGRVVPELEELENWYHPCRARELWVVWPAAPFELWRSQISL